MRGFTSVPLSKGPGKSKANLVPVSAGGAAVKHGEDVTVLGLMILLQRGRVLDMKMMMSRSHSKYDLYLETIYRTHFLPVLIHHKDTVKLKPASQAKKNCILFATACFSSVILGKCNLIKTCSIELLCILTFQFSQLKT